MSLNEDAEELLRRQQIVGEVVRSEGTELQATYDELNGRFGSLQGAQLDPLLNRLAASVERLRSLRAAVITPPLDIRVPSTPAGLTCTQVTPESVDLRWRAVPDEIVDVYEVFKNGHVAGETTS